MKRARRRIAARFAVGLFTLAFALLPGAGRAADPYDINMIISQTGPGSFIGNGQWQALQALQTTVNRNGGIAGRPIRFVAKDDESNPQVAVQLARDLIDKRVPVILGPSTTGSCNAISPLVARDGPVLYCLTPGAHPAAGRFVFATLNSTPDYLAVAIRFLRGHGWKRIAYLVTTDATGQDAEQGIEAAAAAPDSKGIEIVAREHFAVGDISIAAQLAGIRAANPDAVIAWANGTAAGTALHALQDANLKVPVVISSANITPGFIKTYGALLPRDTYSPAVSYYAGSVITNQAMKRAIDLLNDAARVAGVQPDQVFISAWDPAMLLIDALRKLGTDASAAQLRDDVSGLRGWVGVNGPYDFRAVPQRGLGQDAVVIVRWDPNKAQFDPASKLGGTPLKLH